MSIDVPLIRSAETLGLCNVGCVYPVRYISANGIRSAAV